MPALSPRLVQADAVARASYRVVAVATTTRAVPVVKWAGGKGRLLQKLRPLLPADVSSRRYLEPFLGGGAMFFGVAPRAAVLCDVNARLVTTYRCVQHDVEPLIEQLRRLARGHGEQRYYNAVRKRFNARGGLSDVELAAAFIYLNKTCFNGLYRVNRRGEFNVPMGRYSNPKILDADVLRAASRALRDAELRHISFESLLEYARPGDFIYFDPPYDVEPGRPSFTQYDAPFGPAEQDALAEVYRALDARGCAVMMSNSDTRANRARYAAYHLVELSAPRAIACNAAGRGPARELVIRNYGRATEARAAG
jgi:DNA adenine methylase